MSEQALSRLQDKTRETQLKCSLGPRKGGLITEVGIWLNMEVVSIGQVVLYYDYMNCSEGDNATVVSAGPEISLV